MQGVLLLNTTLTVRAGQAASHQGHGWETFTDEVIRAVSAKDHPVVFILWGSHARKKKALIDTSPAHDHRVGPPVAAVGPQRVLRLPAVQPHQRGARGRRPRPHRLAVVDASCRSAHTADRTGQDGVQRGRCRRRRDRGSTARRTAVAAGRDGPAAVEPRREHPRAAARCATRSVAPASRSTRANAPRCRNGRSSSPSGGCDVHLHDLAAGRARRCS